MISRDIILETLNEWNFWSRDLPPTVERAAYEQEVLTKSGTGEIVIVKGVRRSGKSTILLNTIRNLISREIARGEILFVNLEDPRFTNDLNVETLSLIKDVYMEHLRPSGIPWIILDEVQNIPHFEKWLLKEYELKRSHLFVTGSNARLLSREIGTILTGRYLDVMVFPLGFREYLKFKGIVLENELDWLNQRLEINRCFNDYLTFGGFPRVVLTADDELKKAELRAYFDSILYRDIVTRHRLDNPSALMSLSVYLLSHISHLLSINALKNRLRLSFDLIDRYVSYLENAYLIFRVPLFDWSLRRQQVNPQKIYAVDTGLANIASFQVGRQIGQRLENCVFLELLRRGGEIYYYKTAGNLEVDFIVKKDERITSLIQVAAEIGDKKTRERELRALVRAGTEIPHAGKAELILLTPDVQEKLMVDGREIQILDLKKWLIWGN